MRRIREKAREEGYKERHGLGGWVYRETGEEQVVGESTELRMHENAIRNLLFHAN